MRRIVHCESPEAYIWSEYLFLENEVTALSLLKQTYAQMGVPQPETIAFKNVQSFTDYIKQARAIFTTLDQNSLWVQPLLLYYGMTALAKAFVLTKDIHYPESTTVLRHGLSTRRRKKTHFRFFQDDIRVQKDGLFPHVANLLGSPLEVGISVKAEHLLSMIPEIQPTYARAFHTSSLLPISVHSTDTKTTLTVPEKILDHFHVTARSFVEKLNRAGTKNKFSLEESPTTNSLSLLWDPSQDELAHPWIYETTKGDLYLWTGKNKYGVAIPELLAQHMLVFALSMICRYETSLWGEIVCSSACEDAIAIQQLLSIVKRTFPHMILDLIRREKLLLFIR